MSWEEFTSYEDCQCGNGKIEKITRMDDWNRIEFFEIILCEECKEKDRKQREYEQSKKIKFDQQEECVLNYFKENYLEKWLEYFSKMKSKKEIWINLHNAKIEICSLSSFYDRLRYSHNTAENHLKTLVIFGNIPKIIELLKISDNVLNDMLQEPLQYYEEMNRKAYNEAYRTYRHR
ncbi:MAG: hypothetical protein Q8936_01730 [Bacillota bacterium]|nr:hypothetical protein [Bacillota bacterium]